MRACVYADSGDASAARGPTMNGPVHGAKNGSRLAPLTSARSCWHYTVSCCPSTVAHYLSPPNQFPVHTLLHACSLLRLHAT